MKDVPKKERCNMAILTANCDLAFVVSEDKADSFKKVQSDPKISKKMEKAALKLQKNMTVKVER